VITSDGASEGLVSVLGSECLQLSEGECRSAERWEEALGRKFCPSRSSFSGISLSMALVSVPSAVYQGTVFERSACGRAGHPAPCREHAALAPARSISTPTIAYHTLARGFVLLVIKRKT